MGGGQLPPIRRTSGKHENEKGSTMANICDLDMKVNGEKKNIQSFYEAITHAGSVFMGRGASVNIVYDDDDESALLYGDCKWSIKTSLIDDAVSMREHPGKWSFPPEEGNAQEFVTLEEATEKWKLSVEAYSAESGRGFQEHYLVSNGQTIIADQTDWKEISLKKYQNKTEAEEKLGFDITDKEWENQVLQRGGFASYLEFDI